jgi:hypothetical protein
MSSSLRLPLTGRETKAFPVSGCKPLPFTEAATAENAEAEAKAAAAAEAEADAQAG